MNWRLKGLVQKGLGLLPNGQAVHFHLQRRLGGLRDFEHECATKLEDWRLTCGYLTRVGFPPVGARFVEVGTGWYPTFPLCFYLARAHEVLSFDLHRLLRRDLTLQCARVLGSHLGMIAAACSVSEETVSARHAQLLDALGSGATPEAATGGTVKYLAPADASRTRLESGSVDVVFSNSVLEHVPEDQIVALMRESRRILRPGGLAVHCVNCGDHYSYADSSISQLNYLRYTDQQWRVWNNAFLYQNRLRALDFVRIATNEGFDVVLNTANPSARRLEQLRRIPVTERFRNYSPEELCVTSIDFVARKS